MGQCLGLCSSKKAPSMRGEARYCRADPLHYDSVKSGKSGKASADAL